jgi:ABC-type branched-subunit amino acid transport system permease subunit
MSGQKIGTDQWVEQYKDRKKSQSGIRGTVERVRAQIPMWGWLVLLIVVGLTIPIITDNAYIVRVAGTVVLMAILAAGLNLVVGWTGLLDLGFIAFYGIGAYTYAYLSSDFTGVHLPTWLTFLIIIAVTAVFGLLLGSPSLRLTGDYLAIVTLGFGQIFQQLATSLTRVSLPGLERPVNLTGGPNGILNLDDFSLFGWTAKSVEDYYVVLLITLVITLVLVYNLNKSRIGRAWRALREDDLAAEAMGMPTRTLKLLAFAVGAAIAGLSGGLFASWQGSVFPNNFDVIQLIILYTIVIFGGLGSLPGVILASVVMIGTPELLRNIELAGVLFYAGVVITLLVVMRPRWKVGALLAAVAFFGVFIKRFVVPLSPETYATFEPSGSLLMNAMRQWLPIPVDPVQAGNLAFVAVVLLVLLVSRLKNEATRLAVLIPTLYLLAFTWETRLSQEPSVTRLLFVGILLIVLMIYRPYGLLGERRVEVV